MKRLKHHPALGLAVQMLRYRPVNFWTGAIGLAFATGMILCQWGFKDALLRSSASILRLFDADIVMVGRGSVSLHTWMHSFSENFIEALTGDPAIEKMTTARVGYVRWSREGVESMRLLSAVGIDPSRPHMLREDIASKVHLLEYPGHIFFDERSRPEYGDIAKRVRGGEIVTAFLEDSRIRVVDLTRIGVSFGADANALMSIETLDRVIPSSEARGEVELGLVKLKDPRQASRFISQVGQRLSPDVKLMTVQEMRLQEEKYWETSKPIGFIFSFGVSMGLFIGGAILFIVLNMLLLIHKQDYATLMAIGYKRRELQAVIIWQSLIFCSVGFPAGWGIAQAVFMLTNQVTRLQLEQSWMRSSQVLVFILATCLLSGCITLRRLKDSSPIDAFG